jgi:hypothetical protein
MPSIAQGAVRTQGSKEYRQMNPTSYAETIYQRSLQLPEQAAQEALDFIDFLLLRYGSDAAFNVDQAPRRGDASAFISALAGAWGPDFPDDISDADLAGDMPRDEL